MLKIKCKIIFIFLIYTFYMCVCVTLSFLIFFIFPLLLRFWISNSKTHLNFIVFIYICKQTVISPLKVFGVFSTIYQVLLNASKTFNIFKKKKKKEKNISIILLMLRHQLKITSQICFTVKI